MDKIPIIKYQERNYQLQVALDYNVLMVNLNTTVKNRQLMYKGMFFYNGLPDDIKDFRDTIGQVYQLFEERQNFVVDAQSGIILMIIRQTVRNKFIENRIALRLNQVTDPLQRMNKQELIKEVKELKKRIWFLQEQISRILADNQRKQRKKQEEKEMQKKPIFTQKSPESHQSIISQLQKKLLDSQRENQKLKQMVQFYIEKPKTQNKSLQKSSVSSSSKRQDDFDREMQEFKSQMLIWKEKFKQKIKTVKTISIDWQIQDNYGFKEKGKYQGEIKNGKPNGFGTFVYEFGDKLQAQWKQGKQHGKVIKYVTNGTRFQFQSQKGELNGKQIIYWNDGGRVQSQWLHKQLHGKVKKYKLDGNLYYYALFQNGKQKKRLK